MTQNIELINQTINKLQAGKRADSIRTALNNEKNKEKIQKDFSSKQNASQKRYEQAKAKFEEEQRIYQNSQKENALIALEKTIKFINEKLETAGL